MVKKNLLNIIFDRKKVIVLLNVNAQESAFYDVENVAKRKGLSRKKDFHITLMGRATGETIIEKNRCGRF